MSKLLLVMIAALSVAPMGLAHDPAGAPKNYCEPQSDWAIHEYAGASDFALSGSGPMVLTHQDGNLAGDCDSSGLSFGNLGTPCAGFDDPNDPLTFFVGLCDSDITTPFADFDGHEEWALGGAMILACNGVGIPGGGGCASGAAGDGSLTCYGADAHHAEFGSFTAFDAFLGVGVGVTVAADHVDSIAIVTGSLPDPCGDLEDDVFIDMAGGGVVPFGAGLDGAYKVYVQGIGGHVIWP